jgi:hypothetical protein
MGEAAVLAVEYSGADIVDINMGCPVPKVSGSGDGCALMRDPDKAAKIVEAVVRQSKVPVTVKTRSGWDSGSINAVELACAVEAAGVRGNRIHGRTKNTDVRRAGRLEYYPGGQAGGFHSRHCKRGRLFRGGGRAYPALYGADMAMIAAARSATPGFSPRARCGIDSLPVPPKPTIRERVDTAVRQF